MAEREPPAKVKRVNMTPASTEESKLKFRNYTPRDPELKKFILKKDSSEDSLLIKKQYLDRFVALSTGSSVRAHCCLALALAYLQLADADPHAGSEEAQLGPQARRGA